MNQEKSKCAYSGCDKEPLESSRNGYCIFHARAEDKNEKEFKEALENYISEIKAKDLDYNFSGFVFVGNISFREDFGLTIFKEAFFKEAKFQGKADFSRAKIQGGAYFGGAGFQGKAQFRGTKFQGKAIFFAAVFQEGVHFGQAIFQEETVFSGTAFLGEVYFNGAKFQGDAHFEGATFRGVASFEGTEFRARADISPEFIWGIIFFNYATLENIFLTPLNLRKDAWINLSNARLRNTEIRRKDIEGHIMQEEDKNFSKAKEIYLLLKNNFHSLGRYDEESWAFQKEKEMERKSFWHFRKEHKERELGREWENKGIKDCFYPVLFNFGYTAKYIQNRCFPTSWEKIKKVFSYVANFPRHPIANIKDELKDFVSFIRVKKIGNVVSRKELFKALRFYIKYPGKYFCSTFLKYLYGWGERPWRIFLWCAITIFVFSGLYCLIGDVVTKDGILIKSYLKKLYFSGVTFTVLGYGDYSPMGVARVLAFLESFFGVFFIALFVFSFARRTAGR